MKQLIAAMIFLTGCYQAYSQYTTRNGYISFYSKTPLEDIKAENNQVLASIDVTRKTLSFALLMKSFLFRKELMQQHFNENYVESDKYPKAIFKGQYTGEVNVSKDGTYPIRAKGKLTLHGVTREIDVPAMLEVRNGTFSGNSSFTIRPADFAIKIPAVVRDKIAEQVDVSVKVIFK